MAIVNILCFTVIYNMGVGKTVFRFPNTGTVGAQTQQTIYGGLLRLLASTYSCYDYLDSVGFIMPLEVFLEGWNKAWRLVRNRYHIYLTSIYTACFQVLQESENELFIRLGNLRKLHFEH
jgi:hypothetical protein